MGQTNHEGFTNIGIDHLCVCVLWERGKLDISWVHTTLGYYITRIREGGCLFGGSQLHSISIIIYSLSGSRCCCYSTIPTPILIRCEHAPPDPAHFLFNMLVDVFCDIVVGGNPPGAGVGRASHDETEMPSVNLEIYLSTLPLRSTKLNYYTRLSAKTHL